MSIKHTLLFGLVTLTTPLSHGIELSFIRGPLENTGVDADASGSVRSQFLHKKACLSAKLRGLTPGENYQFTVDGVAEADFVAQPDGKACVDFRLGRGPNELDFDPRGKELAVTDSGGNVVLSMIYSGEGEPADLVVDERTTLDAAAGSTRGRVEARYLDQKNKTRFVLHLLGLERGIYTIRVAGEDQAEVDLSKGRSSMITFETNKHGPKGRGGNGKGKGNGKGNSKRQELDFDPRGELVEIVNGDVVAFSGVMLAQIDGLETPDTPGEPSEETVDLTSSGTDPDATGSATVTTAADGKVTLRVAADGLPAGNYSLLIGGFEHGPLVVTEDAAGDSHGEIVFSTAPTGSEVLLDFPTEGQSLEIKLGGIVYLSGTLPGEFAQN